MSTNLLTTDLRCDLNRLERTNMVTKMEDRLKVDLVAFSKLILDNLQRCDSASLPHSPEQLNRIAVQFNQGALLQYQYGEIERAETLCRGIDRDVRGAQLPLRTPRALPREHGRALHQSRSHLRAKRRSQREPEHFRRHLSLRAPAAGSVHLRTPDKCYRCTGNDCGVRTEVSETPLVLPRYRSSASSANRRRLFRATGVGRKKRGSAGIPGRLFQAISS